PAWTVVPAVVAVGGLSLAAVGFIWDVALHIGQGRDEGPFGTPAHFLILGGIYGLVGAAWLAVAMPVGVRRASWIRITRDWHVPPAALAMLAAAFFSMSGFPADDLWHNLFGQDVTLWGPTHLMMISGGVFVFFSLVLFVREGREVAREQATRAPGGRGVPAWLTRMLGVRAASVVIVGFTLAYLQEFAYGVPQFRLLFAPTIIAFTATLGFVVAALAFGPGRALKTWVASVLTLGLLTAITTLGFGEAVHHFPLFLVSALLVEATWRIPYAKGGGARFAVVAGTLVATVGTASELAWSHLWAPIAWPAHLLPEAMLRSLPVAIAGGLIAVFVAAGLQQRPGAAATRPRAWVMPTVALAVAVVSMAALLPTTAPAISADLTLTPAAGTTADKPTRDITVRFTDAKGVDAAQDADWLYAMAWQGRESRVVYGALKRVSRGVYRTTTPLPVYGTWKSIIRLHSGSIMESLPVSMPADSAIPVPAVVAGPQLTRGFRPDVQVLQRERKPDVPVWLFRTASLLVALATLGLLGLMGWALVRQARGIAGPSEVTGTAARQDTPVGRADARRPVAV
ncbi:MAG: hypothetical protein JWP18_1901, partial [Solirubrobacterales bacterium]|nr:hypothetical protein [Solirubrobacterales bacterium]